MASTLNNQAVSLLQEGRIPEALRLCKSAIADLRTTVNHLEQHQQGPGTLFRLSGQASWGSIEACYVASSCKAPWQNLSSPPSPLFQVYTKAFVFRQQHKSWPDGGSFQASVILYNTALMYHLLGLCTGSSRKIQIAKSLYEQAFECMLRCFRRMAADQNPRTIPSSLYLIRMACCNNLGHIHSLGMDDQRMSMCLQELRSCLAQVEQATSVDADPLSEDYTVFVTCVFLGEAMGLPHFRTAPTA